MAQTIGTLPPRRSPPAALTTCPLIGLPGDPATRYLVPRPYHHCYASRESRPVPLPHQERYCYSAQYAACPYWTASGGARGTWRAVDAGAAAARIIGIAALAAAAVVVAARFGVSAPGGQDRSPEPLPVTPLKWVTGGVLRPFTARRAGPASDADGPRRQRGGGAPRGASQHGTRSTQTRDPTRPRPLRAWLHRLTPTAGALSRFARLRTVPRTAASLAYTAGSHLRRLKAALRERRAARAPEMDPVPALSWITPRLAIGRAGCDPAELRTWDIDAVLDVRAEASSADLRALRTAGLQVMHLRVEEHHPPTLRQLALGARWARERMQSNQRLLVQCREGVGRSATVALAALVMQGEPPFQAYQLLKRQRPVVRPSSAQLEAVLTFAERAARPARRTADGGPPPKPGNHAAVEPGSSRQEGAAGPAAIAPIHEG